MRGRRVGLVAWIGLGGCLSVPGPDLVDDACVPAATYAPLADDFSADGLPDWATLVTTEGAQSTVAASGGRLQATPAGVANDYAWVQSAPFDFRAGRIAVEIVALPDPAATSCESWIGLAFGADGASDALRYVHIEDGRLHTRDDKVDFDPVRHRWLQLRTDGQDLHIDLSANAVEWYTMHRERLPALIAMTRFQVGAGTFQDEGGRLGALAVDNLNLPPTVCPDRG
jgi:hypothetical protein